MSKTLKVIIAILLVGIIFVGGYELPFLWRKLQPPPVAPSLTPLPYGSASYIKDGILYTSVAVVPLSCITKITQDSDMSVIIEYSFSPTHYGALTMNMIDYRRLFGAK